MSRRSMYRQSGRHTAATYVNDIDEKIVHWSREWVSPVLANAPAPNGAATRVGTTPAPGESADSPAINGDVIDEPNVVGFQVKMWVAHADETIDAGAVSSYFKDSDETDLLPIARFSVNQTVDQEQEKPVDSLTAADIRGAVGGEAIPGISAGYEAPKGDAMEVDQAAVPAEAAVAEAVAEPTVTEPAEPTVSESAVTEPTVTEPIASEPILSQPTVTEVTETEIVTDAVTPIVTEPATELAPEASSETIKTEVGADEPSTDSGPKVEEITEPAEPAEPLVPFTEPTTGPVFKVETETDGGVSSDPTESEPLDLPEVSAIPTESSSEVTSEVPADFAPAEPVDNTMAEIPPPEHDGDVTMEDAT